LHIDFCLTWTISLPVHVSNAVFTLEQWRISTSQMTVMWVYIHTAVTPTTPNHVIWNNPIAGEDGMYQLQSIGRAEKHDIPILISWHLSLWHIWVYLMWIKDI
jgi:hypothetical protein